MTAIFNSNYMNPFRAKRTAEQEEVYEPDAKRVKMEPKAEIMAMPACVDVKPAVVVKHEMVKDEEPKAIVDISTTWDHSTTDKVYFLITMADTMESLLTNVDVRSAYQTWINELYRRLNCKPDDMHAINDIAILRERLRGDEQACNTNLSGGQIFGKLLTGKTEAFYIPSFSMTYDTFKKMVAAQIGLEPNRQRWIFAGKQLEDGCSFLDYGIYRETIIHCVLRLRGGMLHPSSGVDNFTPLEAPVTKTKKTPTVPDAGAAPPPPEFCEVKCRRSTVNNQIALLYKLPGSKVMKALDVHGNQTVNDIMTKINMRIRAGSKMMVVPYLYRNGEPLRTAATVAECGFYDTEMLCFAKDAPKDDIVKIEEEVVTVKRRLAAKGQTILIRYWAKNCTKLFVADCNMSTYVLNSEISKKKQVRRLHKTYKLMRNDVDVTYTGGWIWEAGYYDTEEVHQRMTSIDRR